jgi:hypothetical protein
VGSITGKEPKHWHDQDGRHRMPDPRRLAVPQPVMRNGKFTGEMSLPPHKRDICHGDPDLKAYWDHLDEHDRLGHKPERQENDPPHLSSLFDKLESVEQQMKTLRELINVYRQAEEQKQDSAE